MVGLHKYLTEKIDIHITALFKHQQNKALHSVTKETGQYLTEAGTIDDVNDSHSTPKESPETGRQVKEILEEADKEVKQGTNAWEVPKLAG